MFVDMQTTFTTNVKEVYDDDETNVNHGCALCELDNENNEEKRKNDDLSASMAENTRANKSLCEIPFSVTLELMKTLDTDRGWESLAAEADYTFDRMQQLGRIEAQPDGSPTRTLLWELGCRNYKVADLYEKLKSARRLREMQILEAYVKEGGQEKKGASVEKKISESSSLFSLPRFLNQVKIPDKKPMAKAESGFSMSGSEINFNQPFFVGKSKTTISGSKNYEDKCIPGTDDRSSGSSFGTCINETVGKENRIPDTSMTKANYKFPLPAAFLDSEKETYKSLPPSFLPSFYGRQNEQPSPSGAENIRQMLSGGSLHTSSNNRSPSESSVENVSPKPSLVNKKPLSVPSTAELAMAHKTCFSHRTLFSVTGGFSDSKLLGEGAFGKVYLGTIHHLDCAIKKIHSSPADSHKNSDQVESELSALLKFRHENIVTLYGYTQNDSELFLVYQYLINGSLEDTLLQKNNKPSLSWERRLNILVGACKGLNFLHTLEDVPLIHGDIKSANILLDQYFEAKIGDLGQARYARSQSADSTGFTHITVAQSTTKLFGTKAYLAPELRSRCVLSVKSDVYALGVVFLEVCSGLRAYDQNRNENSFLVDLFVADVWDKDKSLWKELIQDRTIPEEVPGDIFIDVLKLASRCVNKIKKIRPDTVKLLSEMKDIYKRNKEIIIDERNPDSITTSRQIDSFTMSSCEMPSDSGDQHEEEVICSVLQTYDSTQQRNIRVDQEQRFQQFNSIKTAKSEPQHQPPLKISSAEDSVEMRNHPASGNPVQIIQPNAIDSEAFRLQRAYDTQQEKKIIDRLSTHSLKEDDRLVEEYPSDPQKLQKIDEFDQEQQKSMPCQCEDLEKCNTLQDHIPEADQKKLAQLTAYDEANFSKSSHAEDDHSSLECDPVKLAYLKHFDDELYRNSRKKDNCSDTEQKNAVHGSQESYKQKENVEQTPVEQLMLHMQTELPSNFSTNVSGNRPVYECQNTDQDMHKNSCVRYVKVEESHLSARKEFEFQNNAPNHNGNRRPSDDSNIHNEMNAEKPHIKKPGKEKINLLFSKYTEMKNNEIG